MSRFTGWTLASLKKINGISQDSVPRERTSVRMHPAVHLSSNPITIIQVAIESILGLRCEREYRFVADRRFRFDLAVPEKKIAIEFEGGVWTHGRHTRGKGYINDTKKYNLAVMNGWKLLRYTVEDTKHVAWEIIITDEIRKLIES